MASRPSLFGHQADHAGTVPRWQSSSPAARSSTPTHEVAQPAAAARRLQRLRARPRRSRGARARGRRLGRASAPARSASWPAARRIELGRAGQREPAGAAHPRPLRPPHRRGRVPPRLPPADGRWRSRTGCTPLPWREPRPGAHVARAALFIVLVAGRGRARLPDLDDLRGGAGAARAARARRGVGAAAHLARLRPAAACPAAEKAGALVRHGDDREAGRLRRARQHHRAPVARRRPGAEYGSPATSGSARRRCATRSWCSRRPTGGLSCFLRAALAARRRRATRFRIQRLKDKLGNRSNASSEIEFDGAWARWSARRAAACRRSSRWSTTPGSTACSARRPGCAQARRAGDPPRRAPLARSASALDRAAADAERARRPLRSSPRRRRSPRCASRAPTTSRRRRRARGAVQAARHRGRRSTGSASARPVHAAEALECLGGNGYVEESGMPRLYRESAAQLDLGGLGQRHLPRRAARDGDAARSRSRRSSREVDAGARRRRRGSTRSSTRCASELRRPRRHRDRARGASSSAWRWRCRRRCSCATATRPSPTRSAPRASAATGAAPSARCRPASTSTRSSSATRPHV